MTPDQQRGLRDVPESWHGFLARWRADIPEVINVSPLEDKVVRLRQDGHTYREIASVSGLGFHRIQQIIRIHLPPMANRYAKRIPHRGHLNA